MPTRHDAVLAAIPLVALGGAGLDRLLPVLESTVGVGGEFSVVPFTVLGLVTALGVIGNETVVRPYRLN
ncbi:hypothetical protein BRD00_07160 [Halobacteriales archaeon QS_8_69_26]|nr:MAG: hypothetical protein BRD00_07160 [Halobacteriales archaeon QS_8_69_26]